MKAHVQVCSCNVCGYPLLTEGPHIQSACIICSLKNLVSNHRGVMLEVAEALRDGKVVLAHEGLRSYLGASEANVRVFGLGDLESGKKF